MEPFPRAEATTFPSTLGARATTGEGLHSTWVYLCTANIFSGEGTEEAGMELAETEEAQGGYGSVCVERDNRESRRGV
jgi:hypothetical protein